MQPHDPIQPEPAPTYRPAKPRTGNKGLVLLIVLHVIGLSALGIYWFGIRKPSADAPAQPQRPAPAAPAQPAETAPEPSPFLNNEVEEKESEDLQFMVVKKRAQRALQSQDRKAVQDALLRLRGLRTQEARQLRDQLTRHLASLPAE